MNIITDTLYSSTDADLKASLKIFANFLSSNDISRYVEQKKVIADNTIVTEWWKLEQNRILEPAGCPIKVVGDNELDLSDLTIADNRLLHFSGMMLLNTGEQDNTDIDMVEANLTDVDDNIQTDLLVSSFLKILDGDFGMANIMYQYFLFWEIMFKEEKQLDVQSTSPNVDYAIQPFEM